MLLSIIFKISWIKTGCFNFCLGSATNLQQGIDSKSALKHLKQSIKKRGMENYRRSEIIQFKPGSTFSAGLKGEGTGKMKKLLTYNLREGNNRFRIVSKGLQKKNKFSHDEETQKSSQAETSPISEAKRVTIQEKQCIRNPNPRRTRATEKSGVSDNKSLQ